MNKVPWYMNDRAVKRIFGAYFALLIIGFIVFALVEALSR